MAKHKKYVLRPGMVLERKYRRQVYKLLVVKTATISNLNWQIKLSLHFQQPQNISLVKIKKSAVLLFGVPNPHNRQVDCQ